MSTVSWGTDYRVGGATGNVSRKIHDFLASLRDLLQCKKQKMKAPRYFCSTTLKGEVGGEEQVLAGTCLEEQVFRGLARG